MTYIQGFVVAVPTANRSAYLDHARQVLPLFKESERFEWSRPGATMCRKAR